MLLLLFLSTSFISPPCCYTGVNNAFFSEFLWIRLPINSRQFYRLCQFRLLKFTGNYWGRVRGFPIIFFQINYENSVETNQSFLHASIYHQYVQDLFQPKLKAQITLSSFLKGPNMVSHQLTVVVINVKDPWGLLTSFLSFWWLRQPQPVCHLTIYKTEGGKAFKHDIGFSLNSLMSSR